MFLMLFQLTTSTRRSTFFHSRGTLSLRYFNSRPPHGGRQLLHILVKSGEEFQLTTSTRRSTTGTITVKFTNRAFQLTTSTRRSTIQFAAIIFQLEHFNSRPPHGGRPLYHSLHTHVRNISTHDLHTEVDIMTAQNSCHSKIFQLTTSTRRSTNYLNGDTTARGISTHDLHTEVD